MEYIKGITGYLIVITFLLTLAIWVCEGLAVGLIVSAFDVQVSIAGLCLIFGAGALSTLIPSSPGYVGSLQAAFVLAFLVLGLDPLVGVLSATAVQLILFGSITIAGLAVYVATHARVSPLLGARPSSIQKAEQHSGS